MNIIDIVVPFDWQADRLSESLSETIEAIYVKLMQASKLLKNPGSIRCSQDICEILYSSFLFNPSEVPIAINGTIAYQGIFGNANNRWELFCDEYQSNDVIYVSDKDTLDTVKIEITNIDL